MGSDVAIWDPAHITPKINLCMHTYFKSVSPRVCMAKVPFLAFLGLDMNSQAQPYIWDY